MTDQQAKALREGETVKTKWGNTAHVLRVDISHDGTNAWLRGIPAVVVMTREFGSYLPEHLERTDEL